MTQILITGATGRLGRSVMRHLLNVMPVSALAVLARDPDKARDYAASGVQVRRGDYDNAASLAHAFAGIDKLLFIPAAKTSGDSDRRSAVVDASRAAGVRHVHYVATQRRIGSEDNGSQLMALDTATERALIASGLAVTILRNTMSFDCLASMLGASVLEAGLRMPGRAKPAAMAARDELGEAIAAVVSGAGHEGRVYTLSGSEAVFMTDIAAVLSRLAGQDLEVFSLSVSAFVEERAAQGLPLSSARLMGEWLHALEMGEFADMSGDLERLLGRKPLTATQALPRLFKQVTALH